MSVCVVLRVVSASIVTVLTSTRRKPSASGGARDSQTRTIPSQSAPSLAWRTRVSSSAWVVVPSSPVAERIGGDAHAEVVGVGGVGVLGAQDHHEVVARQILVELQRVAGAGEGAGAELVGRDPEGGAVVAVVGDEAARERAGVDGLQPGGPVRASAGAGRRPDRSRRCAGSTTASAGRRCRCRSTVCVWRGTRVPVGAGAVSRFGRPARRGRRRCAWSRWSRRRP